jgi:hypothetical protein
MDMVEPFVALVIYPTTPDGQSRQADNLARIASEKIRSLPGFLRSRVFVSEDGESLVTLTEWSDESFLQFRQAVRPSRDPPGGGLSTLQRPSAAPARGHRDALSRAPEPHGPVASALSSCGP